MVRDSYSADAQYESSFDPGPPPMQQPPMMGGSFGGGFTPPPLNDPTIAHMRWVPDELSATIYKRLAAVEIHIGPDGAPAYRRIQGVTPKLNNEGIEFVLATIEGLINQFVGLSNISDEEANELIAQYLYSLAGDLVYNQGRFELHTGDMRLVMNVVKGLVFTQVKRAVKGHESRNFTTQHVEQNMQQHLSQGQLNSGFSLNPFKRRGG